MKLPLHLKASDYSRKANARRLFHYQAMFALNPKGFRQQGGLRKRGGKRGQPSFNTRLETLMFQTKYARNG